MLSGKTSYDVVLPPLSASLGYEIGPGLLREAFLAAPVDENMAGLAKRLKRRGFKIGMITDNPRERINAVADSRGWEDLFDAIVVSAAEGARKADGPAIFARALERLSLLADECVFIDDNGRNLAVAANMGFETVLFDCAKRDIDALEKRLFI